MTTLKPRHIRIFISSPGDVADERGIAERVIKDLNFDSEFQGKFTLEPMRWDNEKVTLPMPANETAQKSVDRYLIKPSQCDLVVVIFWAKMGTPVTIDRRDYLSGTHYEYSEALEASAANGGVPQVWVYRCEKEPVISLKDADRDKKITQWESVEEFFASFNDAEGRIIRNYNAYEQPSEFGEKLEEQLKTHLRYLLRVPLTESTKPIIDPEIVTLWKEGKESPFPGLIAFTEEEAPIFFGRGRETDKLVQMVGRSRFVAVVGASGSGKSSLVAAGLIPRLRDKALEGSGDWDIVRCVPGENPFKNLAQALLNDVPALSGDPIEYVERSEKLAESLAKAPDNLHKTLSHVLKDKADWKEVLIFVDQFEELLTLTSENQREAFTQMLTYSSSKVRVVVTIRADFYHRMLKYLEEPLRDGNFTLYKPSAIALYEMISRPAARAGLSFEDGLAEQIVADTGDEPGALALMAYALDELYKLDDDKHLTHDEYEQLGRVQKAIGKRAEDIFNGLLGEDQAKETILFHVFRELLEVDENGTATRRRIQFNPEKESETVREMIAAFADARLLTTNQSTEGATLEVAHEALLREWGRLADWIELTQDDHRAISRMRREARTWDEKVRPEHLCPNAETLKEFEAACERLGVELEDDILRDFTEPEQERLYRELATINTNHERRRDIGDRLAAIDDLRFGVSVKEGLPEIEWLPVVQGGDIQIKGKNFTVKPFYIAKYLVTYIQYQAFAESDYDNPKWWQGVLEQTLPILKKPAKNLSGARSQMANAPRDSISWYQSVAFSRWLDAKYREVGVFEQILGGLNSDDWQIRLSTEWEWQWVAQNGMEKRKYPWGSWQEGYANTREAGLSRSISVGMYPHGAAECGALDMSGNLREWCLNDYDNSEKIDASSTDSKVLRGGSFDNYSISASCSVRDPNPPINAWSNFGVRLILSPPIAHSGL